MPGKWGIPTLPDGAHYDTSLYFVPVSSLGLGVCIRKIYPSDDTPLQPILVANTDCFWGLFGEVPGMYGRTLSAGTGICCEKWDELSISSCCNQAGMLSNTDYHYSCRVWSILGLKWQRNLEFHPFVGWPDTTVTQALKMCVINQVTKQRQADSYVDFEMQNITPICFGWMTHPSA